jgi:hypothetical protein
MCVCVCVCVYVCVCDMLDFMSWEVSDNILETYAYQIHNLPIFLEPNK